MRGITANFEYKIVMIMLKIGCKFRTSGGYFKAKFANFAETLLFWDTIKALPEYNSQTPNAPSSM